MTMRRRTSQQQCSNSCQRKGVPVLSYPAYSPNLSPPGYFAFPKLKMELKGEQHKNISEIQKSVMVKLKKIPIHEWERAMKWLKDHAKEYIRANIDHFKYKCVFYVFILFRDVSKSSLKTYGTHCVHYVNVRWQRKFFLNKLQWNVKSQHV